MLSGSRHLGTARNRSRLMEETTFSYGWQLAIQWISNLRQSTQTSPPAWGLGP